MRCSVAIVSYKRAWALEFCLNSLAEQELLPDEVILVLKLSGDKSEEVINKYKEKLHLHTIIQEKGGVSDAEEMAIKASNGDIILFIDDDAIADKEWIKRYITLFKKYRVGGIGGLVYTAHYDGSSTVKFINKKIFDDTITTSLSFHRQPMAIFKDYQTGISKSGFPFRFKTSGGIDTSVGIMGTNMGFLKKAIEGCPLSSLYTGSRVWFWYEQLLAYWIKSEGGYDTIRIMDEDLSPTVWHISHQRSLTRTTGFRTEFWKQFDRAMMYWRLNALNADVSFFKYLFAIVVVSGRRPLPRLLASITSLIYGPFLSLKVIKEIRTVR